MNQLSLYGKEGKKLINLREASKWASQYLKQRVSISNISYLVQYGRITKHVNNGGILINLGELKAYYDSLSRETHWKQKLGDDLNWHLSFTEYSEAERTKHVHRLHPYKGKFIPQLVEYFLDSHTDEFKRETYFHKGDIVLDPFCGSGTALVQSCELGMHAIGIDISSFNSMITNIKVEKHDIPILIKAIYEITKKLENYQHTKNNVIFEEHLLSELARYNSLHFPSPEYRRKVRTGEINEKEYAIEKEAEFLNIFDKLVERYQITIKQTSEVNFLDKWFVAPVREEIDFLLKELNTIEDEDIKKVLTIILSRTVRSCRATTHADLATLKEPVTTTYYCKKHGKICKPIFSVSGWWRRYTVDTISRIKEFDKLRTDTFQICLTGDSRTIDIYREVKERNIDFAEILSIQKIKGIFTSPPYVGLIDYHEQHAYAYELFGFDRKDRMEIGPLCKGQGREARDSYVHSIATVLINCSMYLQSNFDVFLVANDKYNLYPQIAALAKMRIVNQFKRPVLNRVEKDRSAYAETIFHLKEK